MAAMKKQQPAATRIESSMVHPSDGTGIGPCRLAVKIATGAYKDEAEQPPAVI
jgi:hypothetical protein